MLTEEDAEVSHLHGITIRSQIHTKIVSVHHACIHALTCLRRVCVAGITSNKDAIFL